LQGERPMVLDNKSLGRFDLIGIPPTMRGIPQIEVSFDIDANGIVHVAAKDLGTGKEQSIRITASQKLSEEEINRMRKEAEIHADEDKKRKEEIETLNQAESLTYTSEGLFKDFDGKVDAKELEQVKTEVADLKAMLGAESKDFTAIKAKMDIINQLVQKLSTELYQKAAQAQQQHSGAKESNHHDSEKPKDDVVDADYKVEGEPEKKGKKKE